MKEDIHPYVEKMKKQIEGFINNPDLFTEDEIRYLENSKEERNVLFKYSTLIHYIDENNNKFWLFAKNTNDLLYKLTILKNNTNIKVVSIREIYK